MDQLTGVVSTIFTYCSLKQHSVYRSASYLSILPSLHPCIPSSIYPSFHPYIHLSIHPCIPSSIYPSFHPYIHLSIHPTLPFLHLSNVSSTYLSSFHQSVHLSSHLSVFSLESYCSLLLSFNPSILPSSLLLFINSSPSIHLSVISFGYC